METQPSIALHQALQLSTNNIERSRNRVLDEILEERVVSSREQKKPRGVFREGVTVEVHAEIEALVGLGAVDGLDFEAIERAARQQVLRLAAWAVEGRLNADRTYYAGPTRGVRLQTASLAQIPNSSLTANPVPSSGELRAGRGMLSTPPQRAAGGRPRVEPSRGDPEAPKAPPGGFQAL